MLTREQIFAANDVETVTVEVPEWGGSVKVKSLTGSERSRIDQFLSVHLTEDGKVNDLLGFRILLIQLATVDDEGKPLFNGKDAEAIGKKSATVLDKLFVAASKLNKLLAAEVAAEQANFTETKQSGSGTDSL